MTLGEMIQRALQRLEFGDDPQSVESVAPIFTAYANQAIRKIALKYRKTRKETLMLTDSTFSCASLERGCIKIVDVSDSTGSIVFFQNPEGSDTYECATNDATVDVTYQYYPETLTAQSETPDVPTVIHDAIPHFIVASYRAGGDPSTQSTASVDYQLFTAAIRDLGTATRSNPRSNKIKNWY